MVETANESAHGLASQEAGRQGAHSRALDILLQFASTPVLTAAQISSGTGIPASAVYRHLSALLKAGLVAPANHRGQFSAGPTALRLAANFRQEAVVKNHISAQLQQLSNETEELAAYLVVSDARALCVEAVEGPQLLRCSYSAGLSQPLHHGASALALLANLTDTEQSAIIAGLALEPDESTSLRRELVLVSARGFALSQGAVDSGVWGVSFPVFGADGVLAGAISTMAPSFRAIRNEKRLIASTRAAALILNAS
ncbi:IclR family transcriptional regulator [Arthrobacter sp. GMC3]|uniref:IclR family transcriptional regulator n=1 Tax=Arthrobacter sp. GMC3 TaxID=2058894 RepID=UPI0015E2DE63|nr:IclR family transcriptional regulator C-terminal domain-containing protein [Arthrobacter sp. GMC3]